VLSGKGSSHLPNIEIPPISKNFSYIGSFLRSPQTLSSSIVLAKAGLFAALDLLS
jgi:hypothetical protein